VTARRARIPPRRRFFLGCEGESEQSYGALLQIVAESSSAAAKAALVRQWPEYQKPMPARRLVAKLGLSEIQSAARVEDELRGFLSLLGFPSSQVVV
jgi:hypothetical protein